MNETPYDGSYDEGTEATIESTSVTNMKPKIEVDMPVNRNASKLDTITRVIENDDDDY